MTIKDYLGGGAGEWTEVLTPRMPVVMVRQQRCWVLTAMWIPEIRSRPETPLLPVKSDSQRATPLVQGWVSKTWARADKGSFSSQWGRRHLPWKFITRDLSSYLLELWIYATCMVQKFPMLKVDIKSVPRLIMIVEYSEEIDTNSEGTAAGQATQNSHGWHLA